MNKRFPLVLLVAWLVAVCLSDYSPITQYQRWQEERTLTKQQAFLRSEIQRIQQERNRIAASPETFAREKYLMQRPNEEVFVFVDEKNQPLEKE